MSNRLARNAIIYVFIGVAIISMLFIFFSGGESSRDIDLSEVIVKAQKGEIQRIEIKGDDLTIIDKGGQTFRSRKENGTGIYEIFQTAGSSTEGIDVQVKGSGGAGSIFGVFLNFLPLIFFGGILLFMMRQAQGSNSQTMSFGRSRARMVVGNRPTVTFADVAGVEEAKAELMEVVEFLKFPQQFLSMGARIPAGVLLMGPPGSGKTLLSRAVAGEAGVPFFSISGSEFVEMFVGVGASRVRDLFDQAKRNAPCIVFVDEIDAVGRHRGAGLGGGHDEREQTLNQILVEMDGFDTSTNVIVVAATNRPDILDPALLRPGRFDRRVVLDQPDINGRRAILDVHVKGKPLDSSVNLSVVAKETPGFSGADLSNLVNEAAILAARRTKKTIGMEEFAESVDRVIAGPERRSRVISQKEKEVVAYHEAGHALVAFSLPDADVVHKISIVARGQMGGYTRLLPEEDHYLYSRAQFQDMLATALGGRVAEEVNFHEITTGASNDLEVATHIARNMVTRYGMSDTPEYEELPISTLVEEIQAGNIEAIEVYGDDLLVRTRVGNLFRSRKECDFSLVRFLGEYNVPTGVSGVQVFVKPSKMLDGLGPRTFGRKEELVFLGREISEQRDYGDTVADEIDAEVHKLINRAHGTAREILSTHREKLVQIAQFLIKHETVEGEELTQLMTSPAPPMDDVVVEATVAS